jgi:hypothetical protein
MDERVERARAMLAREGVLAEVGVAGADDDILVVAFDRSLPSTLARLAPAVRALGFRYVTMEVEGGGPMNPRIQ